jgi:Fur family transcriptional regulator, ferric uptake regulator
MTKSSDEHAELVMLQQRMREAGLRCTSARLAVLRELGRSASPLTHAEVADRLAIQGIDKATVFRNLVDLVDADLLTRHELGDHVWRFEVRPPGATDEQHPHFVCTDCGSVTCLSEIGFDKSSRRQASKIGLVKEILLKGICHNCE